MYERLKIIGGLVTFGEVEVSPFSARVNELGLLNSREKRGRHKEDSRTN